MPDDSSSPVGPDRLGIADPALAGLLVVPWLECLRCRHVLDRVHAREPWGDLGYLAAYYTLRRPATFFTFTNPTSEDLSSLRVGVVCYDTAGAIIGGGYDYPDLAPAGKAIRIDASVKTSGYPARCTAYPNYGY